MHIYIYIHIYLFSGADSHVLREEQLELVVIRRTKPITDIEQFARITKSNTSLKKKSLMEQKVV
jgi:hypothetical protein